MRFHAPCGENATSQAGNVTILLCFPPRETYINTPES